MPKANTLWIAQRDDQDWRDDDVLAAIDWVTSTLPAEVWARRLDSGRATFEAGKSAWKDGLPSALFDPNDLIAWYVFQANAHAAERQDWFEPEAFRIAPVFQRLGRLLPELRTVEGVTNRVHALVTSGMKQPDSGLFELLVAAAYKRGGWADVAFVPETPGVGKTQDLLVKNGRRRWSVECKRVNRSGYEAQERATGEALARPFHELCRSRKQSLILEIVFTVELSRVPASYLVDRIEEFNSDKQKLRWER